MAIISSINSMRESCLNTNKKDTGINNKPVSQTNYSEDSYVPSTKFTTALGVYSKETEKCDSIEEVEEKVSFEDEYEYYCQLGYFAEAGGGGGLVYYPPPNASYEVKKAWIETMKPLTVEELLRVKVAIISAVQEALKNQSPITAQMAQDYLNKYASFKDLEKFFTENFLDSNSEKYDSFMADVLDKLKTNYEKYREK